MLKGYFLGMFVVVFVALLCNYVSSVDQVQNDTWNRCQSKFEQSGIPFEGREAFIRGCFENK